MASYDMIGETCKGRKPQKGSLDRDNEDRFFTRTIEWGGDLGDIYLAGVADGIGSHYYGGSVAGWLVDKLENEKIFSPQDGSLQDQLKRYLTGLQERLRESDKPEDFLNSGCTLSLVAAHGNHADCFWVGDSPVYYSAKKGNSYITDQITTPDIRGEDLTDCFSAYSPFELKHESLRLNEGDIITIASDGVLEKGVMFNDVYSQNGFSSKEIEKIVNEANVYDHSDDSTIAAIKRTK